MISIQLFIKTLIMPNLDLQHLLLEILGVRARAKRLYGRSFRIMDVAELVLESMSSK